MLKQVLPAERKTIPERNSILQKGKERTGNGRETETYLFSEYLRIHMITKARHSNYGGLKIKANIKYRTLVH